MTKQPHQIHRTPQTHQARMPQSSAIPLKLQNFTAKRGGRSLSAPLSFTIEPGSVFGILGPNGVGKSSLLAALSHAGVDHTGEVTFGQSPICRTRPKHRAKTISMLTQELGAPEELRVQELVEVGARASGVSNIGACAREALRELGIHDLAGRRLGSLSGGQRQLAQLARVIAQNTPIVALDEPTSALDLRHQHAIAHTMHRMSSEGKIVLTAVHDLNFALSFCTHVLLLAPSGAAHIGAPAEILRPAFIYEAYGVHSEIHTTSSGKPYFFTHDVEPSPLLAPQGAP